MEQEIRNKLRNVITQCRKLLEDSISQELEGKYGIFAKKGQVNADPYAMMTHLSEEEQEARKDILEHFAHIKARGFEPKEALDQLIREIAFTHLNRLCAYKMMEAREVYVGGQKFREAVSRGVNSNGVKFYLAEHPEEERLFNTGHQDVAYRHFLDWLGGALSDEIGVLFNPNDPANRLYPRQRTLEEVLNLLNSGGIKPEEAELREEWPKIWSQDETIGWIYQYFTPKELREKARKENPAPRNSYELAFRNQFFTPRYVVEFLTDNTLGRIWYEMRKGETKLKDQCRYMVRRPTEIFLKEGEQQPRDDAEGRDDLSQEELLKLPVHIQHRPKKDPRELKIIDPACGSGHFLLYCFDMLLTIYEEAYADKDLSPALQKDYPKLEDFRRDVPRLILAHNLHGIDIDLRASQIAALALWLRCQRAYQELGLRKDRPKITRSNFVCAEPMPGEKQMLKEFVDQLEPRLLGQLVEVVFDKMKLAGEAGSLLKIEEEIRDVAAEAKKQWARETSQATDRKGEPLLFTQTVMDSLKSGPIQASLFDLSDLTDDQFFEQAEGKVVDALRSYAETAHNGQRLQRRLFSEDAVRGFAFVDLCHKRFDVVLMNPPFGDASVPSKSYIEEVYGDTKGDVYKTFVECFQDRLVPCGMLGIISNRTGFFLGQSSDWRERVLLRLYRPLLLADLGDGVLDAKVETAAYVLRNLSEEEDNNLTLSILPDLKMLKLDKDKAFSIPTYQKHRDNLKRHQATQELERLEENEFVSRIDGRSYVRYIVDYEEVKQAPKPISLSYPPLVCIRLLADADKERGLNECLKNENDSRYFSVSPASFKHIPGTPFSYETSEHIQQIFKELPSFDPQEHFVKVGLQTSDDFRFVRANWEVPINSLCPPDAHPEDRQGNYCVLDYRWFPFAKGGEYSPYHLDIHLVVDWAKNGEELRNFDRAYIRNDLFYFIPGLTWSSRSTSNFSPRTLPLGCIFSHKGPGILLKGNQALSALGIIFSKPYQTLIELYLAAGDEVKSGSPSRSYEVGIIQKLPWADFPNKDVQQLTGWVRSIVQRLRERDAYNEITKVFIAPFIPASNGIRESADLYQRDYEQHCCEILELAAKVDVKVAEILGVSPAGREMIFGEDAGTLCSLPDQELDDDFNVTYRQSIHDTIRDEIEESGGDRQIAVKAFYASRRLEVLAKSFHTNPQNIAKIAAERHLIPVGVESELVQSYLSYAVGCAFGRWDIRFATESYPKPELSDPFAPLPVYSPGMLTPTSDDLTDYPLSIDQDGILVDDPNHPDDIFQRIHDAFELLWQDQADEIEQEAREILGVKDLRDYFRKPGNGGFWQDHIKRYTKSTKQHSKVPIYWLLQSSKKSYALWLYYHRLDKDLLFKALVNYVEPKIILENNRLKTLRIEKSAAGESGKEAKRIAENIERQEDFLSELRDFEDKLRRAADLHLNPDLNDGIVLNIAPLHELVPWKEAKNYWEELLEGKYEWSSIGKQLCQKGLVQ